MPAAATAIAAERAADLIAESIAHDCIAAASWSPELEAELTALADDSANNGEEVEFWGMSEQLDGVEYAWRVHLIRD